MLYNVMLVSAVQQGGPAVYVHISSPSHIPQVPTSYLFYTWCIFVSNLISQLSHPPCLHVHVCSVHLHLYSCPGSSSPSDSRTCSDLKTTNPRGFGVLNKSLISALGVVGFLIKVQNMFPPCAWLI